MILSVLSLFIEVPRALEGLRVTRQKVSGSLIGVQDQEH